jgi:uncharacterized protein with HEPN domain
MSKRSNTDYLQDIKESIGRIIVYSENLDYIRFKEDLKTQDAVIRNIEIMGEAVKSLTEDITAAYPNIPWKSIAGTRDKLIHDYFGVNIDIVWDIIKN